MNRRRVALVGVAAAVVVTALLLAPYAGRTLERSRVRRAIASYDTALVEALRTFDATGLQDVAMPREVGRVSNYLTLLEGTGTVLEADLLELEVREVESSDTTVTALVYERWRELERDSMSGLAKGESIERAQVLRYILLPDGRGLKVYLSQIVDEDAR